MKILLLDIESCPNLAYVWGLWSQNVNTKNIVDAGYVLCWAAKWLGKKEVMFDSLHQNSHKEMLKGIHALLDEADAVVHYNGSRFDIPTLNKEFILFGLSPPSPYKQIDLLRTARQQFRFPSNKLDYIAKSLKLGEKIKHEGPELWIKCMNKDKTAWGKMKRYNINDVVLLEKVYHKLLPWIKNHPNRGLFAEDNSEQCCVNCGSHKLQRRGYTYTTTGIYQRWQCTKCGSWLKTVKMEKQFNRKGVMKKDNG